MFNCKMINSDNYKEQAYPLLKEGLQKWLMQTAAMDEYTCGHLRLLCSALDCCKTVLINEKVTLKFLNDSLTTFAGSKEQLTEYLTKLSKKEPNWFSAERLLNIISLSEEDGIGEVLVNVDDIKACYTKVINANKIETSGNIVLNEWRDPVLPRDWIYLPILSLYSSSQTTTSPEVIGEHATRVKQQIAAEKEMLGSEFNFDKQLTGLNNFQDFYTQFLEQFQSVSYGDPIFAACVLVPLAQRHNGPFIKYVRIRGGGRRVLAKCEKGRRAIYGNVTFVVYYFLTLALALWRDSSGVAIRHNWFLCFSNT
ncbi:hypothetical protein KGM_207123 [Danaus plexippus plexippus]|uniref:RPAP1/MINIYO-like TPR repeats domain-containing protein n=1 Tax=Danaus plexippus plexippus TaxID=278856 RepID=A0A212FMG8_DANPL|nr:hypothetical protein KGM_207123 [Danaus plexippus plexippus]